MTENQVDIKAEWVLIKPRIWELRVLGVRTVASVFLQFKEESAETVWFAYIKNEQGVDKEKSVQFSKDGYKTADEAMTAVETMINGKKKR